MARADRSDGVDVVIDRLGDPRTGLEAPFVGGVVGLCLTNASPHSQFPPDVDALGLDLAGCAIGEPFASIADHLRIDAEGVHMVETATRGPHTAGPGPLLRNRGRARDVLSGMRSGVLPILLVVLGLNACGRDANPSSDPVASMAAGDAGATSTPAPTSPDVLTGIEWQLAEMVVSGQTVPTEGVDAVLRFDGAGGYSANACNYLEGEVDIADGTLVLQAGMSTTAACDGPAGLIDDALNSLDASTVAWSVDGDGLLLAGEDGTTLQYRERDSVYPGAADDLEVVASEQDGWQYRLSVSQTDGHTSALNMVSRAGPGQPWGTQGLGAPSPGESPLWSIVVADIDGQTFVAGFVPATAAQATHQRTADAEPIELTIHDIGDQQWGVAAGFVPEHSSDSVLSVYDAAGALIAEWAHTS